MSWNGTVRCSNCYGKGHNKAGCPDRKAQYEREKKENPDGWWVRNYEENETRRRKRACSYCKEEGHTKRTCKHIKADKEKTVEMNKAWRADALTHLKSLGLGVGALVQFVHKSSWNDDKVENVLVSEVLWDNLTFAVKNGANPYSFRCRPLNSTGQTRLVDFPADPAGVVSPNVDYGLHVIVLGPISGSSIEANIPEAWLSGEGKTIEDMFLDSRGKPRERCYIDWIEKE